MESRSATKYALLGALMSGPMHGYEILQFLEAGLGSAQRISTSQLYILLKKLEKDGYVGSSLKIQDTRPSKRVFSLKPEGRDLFLEWLLRPTAHVRDLRVEFLTKLFFFERLDLQGGKALIKAQRTRLEQVKRGLIERNRAETDQYKRLVHGFRIATLNGWLDWLKKEASPFVKKAARSCRPSAERMLTRKV